MELFLFLISLIKPFNDPFVIVQLPRLVQRFYNTVDSLHRQGLFIHKVTDIVGVAVIGCRKKIQERIAPVILFIDP